LECQNSSIVYENYSFKTFTEKDEEGFISLRSRTNSSVYKINSVFKQFYFLTKDCDNVKLVFIELPIYSIYWWNKFKGHSNPEQFKSWNKAAQQFAHTIL
jgi:hypothetical protein